MGRQGIPRLGRCAVGGRGLGRGLGNLPGARLVRTRTGKETAYLPDNLAAVQAELAEQFRAVDEVAEEVIGAWLDANPQPVTTNEIATGIRWTPDSRSVYRITTVLKQLGYTRSNKRVRRTWVWTPPGGGSQLEL